MYSKQLQIKVLDEFLTGRYSIKQIAKKYNLKTTTPYYWIYKKFGKEKVIELKYSYLTSLTEQDKAYIAGIIDGEGSIFLTKHNNDLILKIAIVNTSKELMKYLKNKLKGHIGYLKRKNQPSHWKDCYVWMAYYNLSKRILIQVLPYLKIKQEQALIALKWNKKLSTKDKLNIKKQLQILHKK